jgi:hypothetical protein
MVTRARIDRIAARIERLTPPKALPSEGAAEEFDRRIEAIAGRLRFHAERAGEPWPPLRSPEEIAAVVADLRQHFERTHRDG